MTSFQKVADRVRKLRALSESSNPHEAALAAAEAQRLILEHQLDPETLAMGKEALRLEDEDIVPLGDRKSFAVWEEMLGAACARANGCAMFTNRLGDDDGMRVVIATMFGEYRPPVRIRAVGDRAGVDGTKLLFSLLSEQLMRLGRAQLKAGAQGISDFMTGAAETVGRALMKERERAMVGASGEATALVADVWEKILEYGRSLGFVQSVAGEDAPVGDPDAYRAGMRSGERVNVNVGMRRQQEAPRQLKGAE